MTQDEHIRGELIEGSLASFCHVLVWLLVGVIGLFFAIGHFIYLSDVMWTQKEFYYSVIAVVLSPWRIARIFAKDKERVQAHLERNAPPFLTAHGSK